jgi:hypothetical protein
MCTKQTFFIFRMDLIQPWTVTVSVTDGAFCEPAIEGARRDAIVRGSGEVEAADREFGPSAGEEDDDDDRELTAQRQYLARRRRVGIDMAGT